MLLGLLHSRVRVEERLLIEEIERRGIAYELLDAETMLWDIHDARGLDRFDVILDRCLSQTQATTAIRIFERFGVPCVNRSAVIDACSDKLATSLALARDNVATPRTMVAVGVESALAAIEEMGYPCVLKPTVGSWGRLLARVNDRDAAEAVLEHKATLGSVSHSVFYIQEYVNKPMRDLRVFMAGDEALCGISRASEHWITNTARGGKASVYGVDAETQDLCRRASRAVGGGILAIDLLECPERGLLVSEINHTMEFRNSIEPTGVNIPGRIIDFVVETANAATREAIAGGVSR